ncbi:hypothetical protein NHQ30_002013 [Ciborinia camelliae]|nr:hypothetical protein NHQ30_002013 [Ciborinia camelliae]
MVECLKDLKACIFETSHPMLLPFIILSRNLSHKTEIKEKHARDWLLRIEHAVAVHAGRRKEDRENGLIPLDVIGQNINKCHAQTLDHGIISASDSPNRNGEEIKTSENTPYVYHGFDPLQDQTTWNRGRRQRHPAAIGEPIKPGE